MKLVSSHDLISGMPIRDLLIQIQFETENNEVQIARSAITGLTKTSLSAREKSHLTHATEIEHQIRFPLKDRVERGLKKLAVSCIDNLKLKNIDSLDIGHISKSDYLTQTVFMHLSKLGIILRVGNGDSAHSNFEPLLSIIEKNIISQFNLKNFNCDEALNYARERIYCSDYQTAYALLERIPEHLRTDGCHYILGLACNFFGRTDESEIHFKRFLQSDKIISKVKATYVLSMLYLRLHPKEKQNLEIAENYLNLGHELIESNPDIEDYCFHSVFNRNGFALCLFRRGQIVDALNMLDAGIAKLQSSGDGAKSLHQSVLIYNAVQCLKALKRFDDCESRCQVLLQVDPLFPEYWLELSIVFLEQEKYSEALSAIQQAEKIDPTIPEIYALKGFIFLNREDLQFAIQNYSEALRLTPVTSPNYAQFQSDLEYCIENQNSEIQKQILEVQ